MALILACAFAGLHANPLPDISTVPADLQIPELSDDPLENSGALGEFTFLETGFRNHNDAWVLRPSPARDAARDWLAKLVAQPIAPYQQ